MQIPEPELISSRRNPVVRQLRELHEPRGRREQGRLLLEGRHLLEEAHPITQLLHARLNACVAAYAREHGLENACRVLFNLNEFSFVD